MTISETRDILKPPCRVIDFHVHPFSGFGFRQAEDPVDNAKAVLRNAIDAGIDILVMSDVGPGRSVNFPTPEEFRKTNDNILRIRDSNPQRIVPFAYVSPRFPDESCAEIERCAVAHGMKGVKIWVGGRASENGAVQIAKLAAALDIPVLIHSALRVGGNFEGESTPLDAVAMAHTVPNVKIVIAHISLVGLQGIEEIRACPNISIDTSGGDPVKGLVSVAVSRLGEGRVIFGSDAPCRHFGTQLGRVFDNGLKPAEMEAVLYNNAAGLLKIGKG